MDAIAEVRARMAVALADMQRTQGEIDALLTGDEARMEEPPADFIQRGEAAVLALDDAQRRYREAARDLFGYRAAGHAV